MVYLTSQYISPHAISFIKRNYLANKQKFLIYFIFYANLTFGTYICAPSFSFHEYYTQNLDSKSLSGKSYRYSFVSSSDKWYCSISTVLISLSPCPKALRTLTEPLMPSFFALISACFSRSSRTGSIISSNA